jgi:REP element-mobilizing transposase RayT
MARLARVEVFDADEVAIVHVINRTVRRCFLMGDDPLTGKNYDHRKSWMEHELERLAKFFSIDLLCYAILSNHFHLVLRSRPDVVAQWDDRQVARRWLMLCPKRRDEQNRPEEPNDVELQMIMNDRVKLNTIRSRLSDISWWMRFLSQRIAQRANFEDRENGKFWQARFRSVRLLDETAILACAAYVDLNPIRAAMAQTIEASDYTSGQQRALALRADVNECGSLEQADSKTPQPIARSLCPLTIDEFKDAMGGCCHTAGYRASDKGFLPMSVASYLELLDWTARELRSDKRGATPASAAPIFERLGINADSWCELTRDFGKLFSTVAGKPKVIECTRSRRRHQRYKIRNRAKELLVS